MRAGVNRAVEVLAELGMVLADARHRLADGARHSGSSALGGRCGPPIATAEAHLVDGDGALYAHATSTCLISRSGARTDDAGAV